MQDTIAGAKVDGLSDEEAACIAALAANVRAGLAGATPTERRRVYEMLGIRGVVYLDPEGVRLGRRYSFRVEWQVAIPLAYSGSRFRNPVMQ